MGLRVPGTVGGAPGSGEKFQTDCGSGLLCFRFYCGGVSPGGRRNSAQGLSGVGICHVGIQRGGEEDHSGV